MAFFDETVRLARVADLVNKTKVKNEFEHKVVGELPQVIEKRVNEVIDWMVSSELNNGKQSWTTSSSDEPSMPTALSAKWVAPLTTTGNVFSRPWGDRGPRRRKL